MNAAQRQPTENIVVLADDLSGAAELAGLAVAHGFSAEVQRHSFVAGAAQCTIVDTDSRLLPAHTAAEKVRRLVGKLTEMRISPPMIFKKIDSVLRGPVREEIEATLAALNQSKALVIPANPSRGRSIRAGRYFVAGTPLYQTVFAEDPEFPRHSAEVLELLGNAGVSELRSLNGNEKFDFEGIALPDVSTVDEMQWRARELAPDTLAVGAADFFAAILQERFGRKHFGSIVSSSVALAEPKLLVCGSRAAWPTRRQQCVEANIETRTQVTTSDAIHGTMAIGIETDAISTFSPSELLQRLGDAAAKIVERVSPRTLLLEGGATAAAIAERMSWKRFAIAGVTAGGLAWLRPLDTKLECALLIKPGSYDWPADVWRQFCD